MGEVLHGINTIRHQDAIYWVLQAERQSLSAEVSETSPELCCRFAPSFFCIKEIGSEQSLQEYTLLESFELPRRLKSYCSLSLASKSLTSAIQVRVINTQIHCTHCTCSGAGRGGIYIFQERDFDQLGAASACRSECRLLSHSNHSRRRIAF